MAGGSVLVERDGAIATVTLSSPGRMNALDKTMWAQLGEAVEWIGAAGGVAVLAHPGRYRVGELKLHELVREFKEAGGTALEVVTSNHTADQMRRFARLAEDMELEASRGSDFHGPGEAENVELGAVPMLPPGNSIGCTVKLSVVNTRSPSPAFHGRIAASVSVSSNGLARCRAKISLMSSRM